MSTFLRPLPVWCASVLASVFFCLPAAAQNAPAQTIEQECAAMAFAPDGRLAYAVRRTVTIRKIEMQRDDIWLTTVNGKPRRIVDGEKLVRGRVPYSYSIQSMRWSPDGERLTVEMRTLFFTDIQKDTTQEGYLTLLLDQEGKEIKIEGADSIIPEGSNSTWLADGVSVVYLSEEAKPKLLFSIHKVRPVSGLAGPVFTQYAFTAVAWDAKRNLAVAIERDAAMRNPPLLVLLDVQKATRRELAQLDGYFGYLTISPSATQVAYFRDPETLEIRQIADPQHVARVKLGFGVYAWSPDERRILIKRGVERRTGELAWVALPAADGSPAPDSTPQPALNRISLRDFAYSPDGKWIAIIEPGKRNILVFPAP